MPALSVLSSDFLHRLTLASPPTTTATVTGRVRNNGNIGAAPCAWRSFVKACTKTLRAMSVLLNCAIRPLFPVVSPGAAATNEVAVGVRLPLRRTHIIMDMHRGTPRCAATAPSAPAEPVTGSNLKRAAIRPRVSPSPFFPYLKTAAKGSLESGRAVITREIITAQFARGRRGVLHHFPFYISPCIASAGLKEHKVP